MHWNTELFSIRCIPEEIPLIKRAGEFHDRSWKVLARIVGKPWMQLSTLMASFLKMIQWVFSETV